MDYKPECLHFNILKNTNENNLNKSIIKAKIKKKCGWACSGESTYSTIGSDGNNNEDKLLFYELGILEYNIGE